MTSRRGVPTTPMTKRRPCRPVNKRPRDPVSSSRSAAIDAWTRADGGIDEGLASRGAAVLRAENREHQNEGRRPGGAGDEGAGCSTFDIIGTGVALDAR